MDRGEMVLCLRISGDRVILLVVAGFYFASSTLDMGHDEGLRQGKLYRGY